MGVNGRIREEALQRQAPGRPTTMTISARTAASLQESAGRSGLPVGRGREESLTIFCPFVTIESRDVHTTRSCSTRRRLSRGCSCTSISAFLCAPVAVESPRFPPSKDAFDARLGGVLGN